MTDDGPMELLLRGLAIGFVIAAGFGPIGLLTVRRTLESGFSVGFATGLGAATADAAYAAVAAFGAAAIGAAMVGARDWLAVIGGLVLVGLGLNAWRHAPEVPVSAEERSRTRDVASAWASTFALTLTNPMTILSFAAAFAALAPPGGNVGAAIAVTAGVGIGSAVWWLVLSGGVSLVRRAVSVGAIRLLRQGSALLLIALGIGAILSVVFV